MANGAFKFKDNSGNVVSFISGSGSNISFSGGTLDLSGMTGLTLGNLTLSGTTQNALSASHAASYLLTSSFNTYSGTTNTVIGTLQTSTSSLNSFTSSATTRLNSIETSTGSLNSYTSSNNTRLGVIESTTASLNSYTSSNNTKLGVIESTTASLNSYTSSNTTNVNAIHTSTGSLNTFTSSATTRLNSIEGVSGSYATTGSNQFKNNQVITGSLTVTGFIDAQELRTTYISSSILYRSGSTKFGDELSDTHSFTGSLSVSGSISVPGSNLVSGSSQVLNGSGVFSGSAQLPSGIVSSSAQTIANLPSGVVSGSAQTIANLPSGTVSGSSQVLAGTTIHSGSFFNGVTVVSGSAQILNGTGFVKTTGASITYDNSTYLTTASATSTYLPLAGGTLTGLLLLRYDGGTSVDSVIRLRGTNTTARTTRLQFEDYNGTLADGLIDFKIATAGVASSATLSIGVNSPGLTFNNTNVATFSSTIITPSFIQGTCTTSTNGDAFRAYASTSSAGGSQPGIGYYTSAGSKRFINQLDVTSDTWGVVGTTGTNYLTITQAGVATFGSTVFVGGNLFFDVNGTVKTISNYGYGGAIQLLRSDSTSTRWARIGMVDATATNFLGGMTINNDISATFSNKLEVNNGGTYTDGAPPLSVKSASWAIVDATTYRQFQRRIGYAADYLQHVILLHPIYNASLIEFNKVSGTIYSTRGWTYAGYINDTYDLDTGTAYSSFSGTLSSKGGLGRLYTCLYNGVKYLALIPEYRTSATSYHFDGYVAPSTAGESLKLVSYRNSSTAAILNSEINNSLTPYTENDQFINGLFYPRQGVRFASGATTLNYYEEGTFNPTSLGTTFNGVTPIFGRYVRIGNQVTINCRWNVDVNTTGMKYIVFDLPFAFLNNNNVSFTGVVSNYSNGNSSASSNVGTSVRNSGSSTTQQYVEAYYTSTGTGVTLLFSMTYQTF